MSKELNWRLLLLGAFLCAIAAVATPYVTLKLGMSVDLTFGGIFLAAAVLGRRFKGKELAIQLNILQTMIGVVSGVGFMCVILASYHYIQVVWGRDIAFNPTWWQVFLWLLVSANLGVFMGALPRRTILNDPSLPWPTGKAMLGVAQTLTDAGASAMTALRRRVLTVTTIAAGFVTFLKDGFGVITPMVANPATKMLFSLELAAIGFGMLVPLAVGLSGLLGVWFINVFGEMAAKFGSLAGTAPEHVARCGELMGQLGTLTGAAKDSATAFLTSNCGKATEFLALSGKSGQFKFVVQWMMWPATAMMVAAALTSVLVPLIRNALTRSSAPTASQETLADESIPSWWIWSGIAACVLALVWLQGAWFAMSWKQVLLAVAIQPVLIIAGLRVLGLTGQGPVSLMANATQFVFGLIWPAHIQQNLNAAHVSADPQASSEQTVGSFWIARRLGGKFRTLIVAQLLVIPIGALLLPITFNLLEHHYGIGLKEGQLSAPTGLKIASLAMVMEKGLAALPPGALAWSIVAIVLGVLFELLLMVRVRDADGTERQRFWWVPIPSMFGFALILPPPLMIAIALGSMISWSWKKFSPEEDGMHAMLGAPLAAGLVAGEAIVGAILLPLLGALVAFIMAHS